MVEDDVWIGTHAVVCDGVTVGAHSVVAAGAVVTTDVPPWSVVGGVPARVLSDRRDRGVAGRAGATSATRATRGPLERFDAMVAEQWPDVLERCRVAGTEAARRLHRRARRPTPGRGRRATRWRSPLRSVPRTAPATGQHSSHGCSRARTP